MISRRTVRPVRSPVFLSGDTPACSRPGCRPGQDRPARSGCAAVAGGLLWALSITTAGHVFGTRMPGAGHNVLPAAGLLVLAFPLPIALRSLGRWVLATRDRRDQAGGAKNSSAMPSGSRNDTPEP